MPFSPHALWLQQRLHNEQFPPDSLALFGVACNCQSGQRQHKIRLNFGTFRNTRDPSDLNWRARPRRSRDFFAIDATQLLQQGLSILRRARGSLSKKSEMSVYVTM